MRENGITLIALVITIIILLILAGVTINMVLDNEGIIGQAIKAKERQETADESEKIVSVVDATKLYSKIHKVSITEEKVKEELEAEFGEGKVQVKKFEDGTCVVKILGSKREYKIDKNGVVELSNIIEIADTEGLSGEGTQEEPYRINSIEDLIYLSKQAQTNTYNGKYIELERDLDFQSFNSYIDAEKIVDEETGTNLITSMTTGEGFMPIGNDMNRKFIGNFDGKNNTISNLYQYSDSCVGLFGYTESAVIIKNLKLKVNVTSNSNAAGGLVAVGAGNITNCSIYGDVTSNSSSAGGIVGTVMHNRTINIVDCYSNANISGDYGGAGSIVGTCQNNRCYNYKKCI